VFVLAVLVRWFGEAPGLAQLAQVPVEEFVGRQMPVVWAIAVGSGVWGIAVLVASRRAMPALVPLAALVVTVVELFVWGIGFNPTGPRRDFYAPTPTIEVLREVADGSRVLGVSEKSGWGLRGIRDIAFPPNSSLVYGLRGVQGYDSLHTLRFRRFAEALEGADPCPSLNGNLIMLQNVQSPLLSLTGTRWLLAAYPLEAPNVQPVGSWFGAPLYENVEALPRAFVARVEVVGDAAEVPPGLEEAARRLLGGVWRAYITTDGVNRVAVRVTMPSEAAGEQLVLTDALLPGWRAFVDGHEALIERAYYLFRAVSVPPGEHRAEFVYLPETFRVGLFLSLVGVGLAAGCAGWAVGSRRREEPAAA
jgi:hypothetical protein